MDMPRFKWAMRIVAIICAGASIVIGFDVPSGRRWKYGFLFLISGVFGFILKLGSFQFICSFEKLLTTGDVTDFTHALHMIFWSSFFVLIVDSQADKVSPLFNISPGASLSLSRAPIGVALCLGAFLFGMGMQLSSGCAVGTLVGMGRGFAKSWIAIWFFILGATIGTLDPIYKWWSELPKTAEPVVIDLYMLIWTGVVFFIFLVVWVLQRTAARREREGEYHFFIWDARSLMTVGVVDDPEVHASKPFYLKEWWRFVTDVVLAICIGCYFICVGSTIGIMGVLPLIGSKFLQFFTDDVDKWKFWVDNHATWEAGILNNVLFYSDMFIIVGSLLASAIMGDFGKKQKNTLSHFCKAMIGGFLMGFGARMGSGCNVGSMLSGINSGSVHGWVWMACAALGSGSVIWTHLIVNSKWTVHHYDELN